MAKNPFIPLQIAGKGGAATPEDVNRVQEQISQAFQKLASKPSVVAAKAVSPFSDAGTGSSSLTLGTNAPFVSPNTSNKYLKITLDGVDYLIPAWTLAVVPSGPPLTGLLLWVKGDTGITLDGSSNVSAWADQSGNGNDLVQTSAGNRPPMSGTAIAGVPAVAFDSANDVALGCTMAWGADLSVVAVTRRTGSGSFPRVIDWGYPVQNRYLAVGQSPGIYFGSSSLNFGTTAIGSIVVPLLTIGAGTATSYQDTFGSSIGTVAEGAGATTNIHVGGLPGTGQSACADIAEVLLWDHALDGSERTQLQAYLHTRGYI